MAGAGSFWSRCATLTPAQREAVGHTEGPLLVVAGPGSGKTTVITHRVAYLLDELGVKPSAVLVVTFTRAAAEEMKGRAQVLIGPGAAGVTFGTIHALAYRILRTANGAAPAVLDDDEGLRLVRGAMRSLGLNTDDDEVLEMAGEISAAKCSGDPAGYGPRQSGAGSLPAVLAAYEKERQRLGKLDFDDLLLECRRLLLERPALLADCRRRWQYVLVDEFQDTNGVQYDIVRQVAAPRNNLCVVGDDDQSIYGWRGANPRALLDFPKDYPGCRQVLLTVNHRSTGRILQLASSSISRNAERFAKPLTTPREVGLLPELWRPADSLQEALRVAKLVKRHVASGGTPAHVGVIYRVNQQAHTLSQVLEREGIPYRVLGGLPNLYLRWPVQDVLAYLRLAAGQGTWDQLEQVINRPNRYVSRQVLTAARRLSQERNLRPLSAIGATGALPFWHMQRLDELAGHLERVSRLQASEAIGYVRSIIGYDDYLSEYYARSGGSAEEAKGLLSEVQRAAPAAGLAAFLQEVESRGSRRQGAAPGEAAVTLTTCHKAKGLEFPLVVVCGAVDGLLPHRSNREVAEERRLFYVALTRARDQLAISSPRQWAGRDASPSPFVLDVITQLAPTAGDKAPAPLVVPIPKPTRRRRRTGVAEPAADYGK